MILRGVARAVVSALGGVTLAAAVITVPAGADEGSSLKGSSLGSSVVTKGVVQRGDGDPFYDTAGINPAKEGEILRTVKAPYSNILGPNDGAVPSEVDKVMYTTKNASGELTAVTGYVVEPTVPWTGGGPRPTLVVVRGTVGQGDQCAPSRNWPVDGQPDPVYSGRFVNLEGLYDMVFAHQGVRVVVSDLIGMGTAEMHTYMNRDDQAHAMLDAARAARTLVESRGEQFGKVALYGHSQGGGASAAAAEAQPEYAPDLNLVAAYASAPPADLDAVQKNIDGSDLAGVIGSTINGLAARYSSLRSVIDANVNDNGKAALENVATLCTDEIMDQYGYATTREWITGDRSLTELLLDNPDAARAMSDQFIGAGTPQVPVMVVSGRYDRNVDYSQAKSLARNWCAKGVNVYYRDDILPELGTLGEYNHVAQAASGSGFGMPFILARLRGDNADAPAYCTNFNGNGGSDAAALSAAVSSMPLSSL
ncbi:putative inactive lipase [Corynebacterium capitovis DSM 44611]|nr:alpha/beta fold hydrolase [Corynebacterium capitovis]WKD56866.1 putative inactive lipase [Corynebacterium capitovis DSM 44611]